MLAHVPRKLTKAPALVVALHGFGCRRTGFDVLAFSPSQARSIIF
jgi:hypothetical protein